MPTESPTATKETPPAPVPDATEVAVIVLRQEGGFAGVENEWEIYADGRVVTASGDELQVEPEEVAALLARFEESGFFELDRPEPASICCDFFTFSLIVRNGESENVVVISEGDPDVPRDLTEAIAAVQELILSGSD